MTESLDQIRHPPSIRFRLWLGNRLGFFFGLGFTFVPEGRAQVVYCESRYLEVRGPGIVRYRRWNETLGPLVHTSAQVKEYVFAELFSRDTLPVSVRLRTVIAYEPRNTPREIARVLTKLPREAYPGIAEPYFRWALMAAVNKYNATEVTQHEVTVQIEDYLHQTVPKEMEYLGIQPRGRPKVLGVELPRTLGERHEIIAQRRASIAASGGVETDPTAIRRALVTELIEHLDRHGAGETFINFNDMLEAYAAERKPASPAPRIVENAPQSAPGDDTAGPAEESRL